MRVSPTACSSRLKTEFRWLFAGRRFHKTKMQMSAMAVYGLSTKPTNATPVIMQAPSVKAHRRAFTMVMPRRCSAMLTTPPNIDPKAAEAHQFARIGMNEMIQATQDRRLAQLLRLAPMRAAIDERLNDIAYIVPGLGDAGDRQFGPR